MSARVTLTLAAAALVVACAGPSPAGRPVPIVLQPTDTVAPRDSVVRLPFPAGPFPRIELPPHLRPDVLVCAGGDVMVGNNLDTAWAVRRGVPPVTAPGALLDPLRLLVADADVLLLNIEGAIGDGPALSKCRPGSRSCYAFRQSPEAAPALRALAGQAAFVGNVANNHAMDAGLAGFEATARHLRAAGAHVTGADTLPTVVVTARGDTVAFLGFSTFAAGPDARDLAAVARHVARAAARYPRTVVSVHMGAEGVDAQRTRDVTETFLGENRGNPVAFARAAAQAGASAVIGHGPHVLRAAEWRDDAIVLYSLGNLLTYGPFSLLEPLNRGAIACVRVAPSGRATGAELRSTYQRPPGIVSPDPTGRGAWLVDSLSALDFPETGARVARSGVLERPRLTAGDGKQRR